MKKFFLLLLILTALAVLVVMFIPMVEQEELKLIRQRASLALMCSLFAFLGNVVYDRIKKSVFGGWMVQIVVNGQLIEKENEYLDSAEGEKIIDYKRPWWVVFFFSSTPILHRNLGSEQLLRFCCRSQGVVEGDVRDGVTFNQEKRVITIHLIVKESRLYPASIKV